LQLNFHAYTIAIIIEEETLFTIIDVVARQC